jgi:hypothetical protein
MDNKKRNQLKKQIKVAASLTDHQAGKVMGAVLTVIGGKNVENMLAYNDTFAEDTDSKEIIHKEAPLPIFKAKQRKEDCAMLCSGTLCDGCPDFIAKPATVFPTEDKLLEGYTKMASRSIDDIMNGNADIFEDEPPFELDEEAILTQDINIPVGSVILTPKEFELIRHTLKGAIKSAINEKVNVLRKHGDNPEYLQEAIEDILIISKLSARLDKS